MNFGPPPLTDKVEDLRSWCMQLYEWLKYPDKLEVQFIELQELSSDPSAPGTNRVRIYAKDDTDKTELSARFSTGAVQQIAQEP